VGYVGQIDDRKDPMGVVRFAEALGEAHLLFAGREEPATAAALDARLAASPLRDRVLRLGPQADLRPAFTALDLYAMTSRNEGFFPIALIEALERGVPVLAPTVGGIGTVLKDGEGGFLMEKPDDRRSVPEPLLVAAAARLAPMLADPEIWEAQRTKAHAFGASLTRDYDAAARFREAVAEWL
jgi:glycosyltransferase involved in cell wall biosynthesis